MPDQSIERRLTAILCADVVGYTRMMGADEAGTLRAMKTMMRNVVEPSLSENGGRIFKTMGDGFLAEFNSAVAAVQAAWSVQSRNSESEIVLRIGITLGDVMVDGDDLLGEGVNIAARLQEVSSAGGICVSAQVHEEVRRRLDLEFRHDGPTELKNVAEPIDVWRWPPETATERPASEPAASQRPSIVVLPFGNLSSDQNHEHFADAITEDLITALSRLPGFAVIGRGTSFSYKGRHPGLRQIAQKLGIEYALEGSIRWSGDAVRINAQLSEAATASQIWAQNFDGQLTDVFSFQDEITRRIVASIQPELIRSLAEAPTAATPKNMDAWIAFARGRKSFWRWAPDNLKQAEGHFREAIALEPNYADAHALLSIVLWGQAISGFTDAAKTALKEAATLAARALAIDEYGAIGHLATSIALLSSGRHDDAMMEAERAIELLPGQSDVLNLAAIPMVYGGAAEQALAWANESLKLNPREPTAYGRHQLIATALFALGRYEESLAAAERVVRLQPDWLEARTVSIANLVQLGQLDEASRQFRSAQEKSPGYSVAYALRRHPFKSGEIADRLRNALELASR